MDSADENVIGAFSEDQAEALTGVSRSQLRAWYINGFFEPSYLHTERRAFARIYSFRDIVSLRVLNQLRNVHKLKMSELRKAAAELKRRGYTAWAGTTLWVHRDRVVFEEPETGQKRELTTNQYVVNIPIPVAIADTRKALAKLNRRDPSVIGHITRNRYINRRAPSLAGTRVPVKAIKEFATAGYTVDQIIKEYPVLTPDDVRAALEFEAGAAVA